MVGVDWWLIKAVMSPEAGDDSLLEGLELIMDTSLTFVEA